MSVAVTGFLILVAIGSMIPAGWIAVQVGAAFLRRARPSTPAVSPRIAVVMPAHNEAGSIGQTVACLTKLLPTGARLLVVADNCTDATAEAASAAGARVLVRSEAARRGKGYALDHGISALAGDPPDVVIFVDADCVVDPGAIEAIAKLSHATLRPVQARYAMQSAPSAGPLDNIARFAWTVKTFVRPLGAASLGWPCQLMGTGMAIPWEALGKVDLATGHLAEDQKLGADLALVGSSPMFCPEARVMSSFPSGKEGKRSQRTRWEHGHLAIIREYCVPLLICAVRKRSLRLMAFALDLCVPPLSLLALVLFATVLVSLGWLAAGGSAAPLLLSAGEFVLFGLSIAAAWRRFGRDTVSLRDLLIAPVYCVLRIPSYFRFFLHRQIDWIRTERT